MRSAIITSPVNLVMAEATSNRIIFLPASKSNVTRMQRKKKKKKFITRVDVLTFPVKLTLKREYSFRRALDFIQRDRKIFIGKLSFSFLPTIRTSDWIVIRNRSSRFVGMIFRYSELDLANESENLKLLILFWKLKCFSNGLVWSSGRRKKARVKETEN